MRDVVTSSQFTPGDGDRSVTSPSGVSDGLRQETPLSPLLKIHSLFEIGQQNGSEGMKEGMATIIGVASQNPFSYTATVEWFDGGKTENATVTHSMLATQPYLEGSIIIVTTWDIL